MNAASRQPPLLALSMGDPAGIGPEIIIKACATEPALMLHCCAAGDMAVLQRALQVCRQQLPNLAAGLPRLQAVASWQQAYSLQQPGILPVLQACDAAAVLPAWGQVQAEAGRMAAQCIAVAAQAALQGDCAGVVTAPIHKEALKLAGVAFPGHTELLQALAAQHAGVPVADLPVRMMLANPELKTVLNSIHVSLRQAIDCVQPSVLLQTLRITHAFLQRTVPACRSGQRLPRIAVAGLNPHAGEGGLFGNEEQTAILPAIAAARSQGIEAHGPFPPDTVFMQARRQSGQEPPFCDAVIAMYHDQGLIPVKYLGVEHGVNVTLGLPLVRTSPDHGTAFDLAGTAQADCTSLLHAVRMALNMV